MSSRGRPQLCDLREGKADWRWKFLEVLAASGCVSSACMACKVSIRKAQRHRARFPLFAAKWDEALDIAVEILEVEARARALDRKDPGSSTLLIFLLKAHKPDMYRETVRQVHSNDAGQPLNINYVNDWRQQSAIGPDGPDAATHGGASGPGPAAGGPPPVSPPGPDRGPDGGPPV